MAFLPIHFLYLILNGNDSQISPLASDMRFFTIVYTFSDRIEQKANDTTDKIRVVVQLEILLCKLTFSLIKVG